jgi:hypothetical protein
VVKIYHPFGPFKRRWPLVTGLVGGGDGLANVLRGFSTETLDQCSLGDAKPYLDLVQP